jgi:polyhydroxybutyrate depolymerase
VQNKCLRWQCRNPRAFLFCLFLALLVLCVVSVCAGPSTSQPTRLPSPTAEPTQVPSPTAEPTQVPLATVEPTPTSAPHIAPSAKYQKPGNYIDTMNVKGTRRWFTVHLPTGYQAGAPMPLVLNLHAYSSDAFEQETLSQMNAKADEEGFIVVNPQALHDPPSWWGPLLGERGRPDHDFFQALLPYLQDVLSVDAARIFVTGMSNGGTMTYRLGCDMADTFAAIAPVSGGHVAHPFCEPERPISVLVMHGTDDRVIPYHGNQIDSPPVHVWLEAWAGHNQCDPTPRVQHPYQYVTQETWTNCAGGVEVMLYTLEGGGHTWPGAMPGTASGSSFPYMDATEVIWDFFQAHPRPDRMSPHAEELVP